MKGKALISRLKALVGKVRIGEAYTLLVLAVGIPFCVYIFAGWKWCVVAVVVVHGALGIIAQRGTE